MPAIQVGVQQDSLDRNKQLLEALSSMLESGSGEEQPVPGFNNVIEFIASMFLPSEQSELANSIMPDPAAMFIPAGGGRAIGRAVGNLKTGHSEQSGILGQVFPETDRGFDELENAINQLLFLKRRRGDLSATTTVRTTPLPDEELLRPGSSDVISPEQILDIFKHTSIPGKADIPRNADLNSFFKEIIEEASDGSNRFIPDDTHAKFPEEIVELFFGPVQTRANQAGHVDSRLANFQNFLNRVLNKHTADLNFNRSITPEDMEFLINLGIKPDK